MPKTGLQSNLAKANRPGQPLTPQPKIIQNGINRPRSHFRDGRENISHKVWVIADKLAAANANAAKELARETKKKQTVKIPTARDVLAECAKDKTITFQIFRNEFYKWRKFYGVRGYKRKDGKITLAMGYQGGKRKRKHKNPGPARNRTPIPLKVVTTSSKPPFPKA